MQYVIDQNGQKTGVLLTMEEWEKAENAIRGFIPAVKPLTRDVRGTMDPVRAEEMKQHIYKQRKEGR